MQKCPKTFVHDCSYVGLGGEGKVREFVNTVNCLFVLLQPEHFTASTRALEEFNINEKAVITDAAISDDLCFVLPR